MFITEDDITELFNVIHPDEFTTIVDDIDTINSHMEYMDAKSFKHKDKNLELPVQMINIILLSNLYLSHSEVFREVIRYLQKDKRTNQSENS